MDVTIELKSCFGGVEPKMIPGALWKFIRPVIVSTGERLGMTVYLQVAAIRQEI